MIQRKKQKCERYYLRHTYDNMEGIKIKTILNKYKKDLEGY